MVEIFWPASDEKIAETIHALCMLGRGQDVDFARNVNQSKANGLAHLLNNLAHEPTFSATQYFDFPPEISSAIQGDFPVISVPTGEFVRQIERVVVDFARSTPAPIPYTLDLTALTHLVTHFEAKSDHLTVALTTDFAAGTGYIIETIR